MVPFQGVVANSSETIEGDEKLMNVVLPQELHELFDLLLLDTQRQFLISNEQLGNKETNLPLCSFNAQDDIELIKDFALNVRVTSTQSLKEDQGEFANLLEPGCFLKG